MLWPKRKPMFDNRKSCKPATDNVELHKYCKLHLQNLNWHLTKQQKWGQLIVALISRICVIYGHNYFANTPGIYQLRNYNYFNAPIVS